MLMIFKASDIVVYCLRCHVSSNVEHNRSPCCSLIMIIGCAIDKYNSQSELTIYKVTLHN